jgi:hypothetical protein
VAGGARAGPYESGGSGRWRYAYCTGVHSSLDHGYVNWAV